MSQDRKTKETRQEARSGTSAQPEKARPVEDVSGSAARHQHEVFSPFFRSLLDTLSDHIAVLDENGTIIVANEAWRRYGETNTVDACRSLVGENYLAVCDAAADAGLENATVVVEGLRAVLGHRQEDFSHDYACQSGTGKHWFHLRARPLEGDGPLRVMVVHEDITEQKRAMEAFGESEKRFQSIFFQGGVGIAISNVHDEQIVETNLAFQDLLGYSADELKHISFKDITHPDDLVRSHPDR